MKRILAIILLVAMMITMIPANAVFAEGDTPIIVTPMLDSTSYNLPVQWTTIPGAKYYEVSLLNENSQGKYIQVGDIKKVTANETSFTRNYFTEPVYGGSKNWKVKVDVYNSSGEFWFKIESSSFVVDMPQLSTPNPKFSTEGVLSWDKVPGATYYTGIVFVGEKGTEKQEVLKTFKTANTSIDLSADLEEGYYYCCSMNAFDTVYYMHSRSKEGYSNDIRYKVDCGVKWSSDNNNPYIVNYNIGTSSLKSIDYSNYHYEIEICKFKGKEYINSESGLVDILTPIKTIKITKRDEETGNVNLAKEIIEEKDGHYVIYVNKCINNSENTVAEKYIADVCSFVLEDYFRFEDCSQNNGDTINYYAGSDFDISYSVNLPKWMKDAGFQPLSTQVKITFDKSDEVIRLNNTFKYSGLWYQVWTIDSEFVGDKATVEYYVYLEEDGYLYGTLNNKFYVNIEEPVDLSALSPKFVSYKCPESQAKESITDYIVNTKNAEFYTWDLVDKSTGTTYNLVKDNEIGTGLNSLDFDSHAEISYSNSIEDNYSKIAIIAHDTWLNGKYLVCTISNEYGTVKSKNINLVVTDDYECSLGENVNIPIYEVGKGTDGVLANVSTTSDSQSLPAGLNYKVDSDGWLYLYGTPTECSADHYYGTPWSLKFNSIKIIDGKRISTQIDIKLNIKCSPSSEYSYDNNGHYHPCIGCQSFYDYIDYEEHRFQVISLDGNTVTMKCAECGYDEELTVYPYNASNIVYDGNEHKVDIDKVTNKNGTALTYYTDYRISYDEDDDYKNAGIHKVYVKGTGKYSYTKAIEYEIKKLPVSGVRVTLSPYEFDYDGTEKTPSVVVIDSNGKVYKENIDYEVSYSPDRIKAGTYTVSVYGIGNYDINGSEDFTITSQHEHKYAVEWMSDDANHWKECVCGEKSEITAHTFKWIIDKEATSTLAGSKHEECEVCGFKKTAVIIDKLPLNRQKITTAKIKTVKVKSLKKKAAKISLKAKTDGNGKLTYKVTNYPKGMKKYIKVSKKGEVTIKKNAKKGKYKITITAKALGNYAKTTKVVTIKVK